MKRMRMKDLERVTGVGRETVRYYISEGLLPQPERPSRNAAWYDESFVERIALIKELQSKRFLPLAMIKVILDAGTRPTQAQLRTLGALDGRLFPALSGVDGTELEPLEQVARRCRLAEDEIGELASVGVIEIHDRSGAPHLSANDARIVELWARLRKAGFTPELGFDAESLRIYVNFVSWLTRQEMQQFARGITGRVEPERAARMAEAGIGYANQIIALLHHETLLRNLKQENLEAWAGDERGEEPEVA